MARRSLIRRSIAADVEPDGLVIVTAHTNDGTCVVAAPSSAATAPTLADSYSTRTSAPADLS